jgi:hypothetical protein
MEIKKFGFLGVVVVGLVVVGLVVNGCGGGDEKVGCGEEGGIGLDFSGLPKGALVMFTVDRVVGIRLYDPVRRAGNSLWCADRQEVPPGSGCWRDAAVMLLFCRLSCHVCTISAEVHGHGNEARIVATQRDGTSQTAICPGDKKVLRLNATTDNPFVYAVLSGQEAQWLGIKLN